MVTEPAEKTQDRYEKNRLRSTTVYRLMLVPGVSIGKSARALLRKEGGIGRVHSVFDRTFYILTGNSRLMAVVGCQQYNAPINLRIGFPEEVRMKDQVRRGMLVRRSGDKLLIGYNLSVCLRKLKVWRPRELSLKVLDARRLLRIVEKVEHLALRHIPAEGLGELIAYRRYLVSNNLDEIPSNVSIISRAAGRIAGLIQAVRKHDAFGIKKNAIDLIGLGPGLTPSGDDFLVGFFGSLIFSMKSYRHCPSFISRLLRELVFEASSYTTRVSEEFLRHAADGDTAEPINDLLTAMLQNETQQLDLLTSRVIHIGETSGSDLMLGILSGVAEFLTSHAEE